MTIDQVEGMFGVQPGNHFWGSVAEQALLKKLASLEEKLSRLSPTPGIQQKPVPPQTLVHLPKEALTKDLSRELAGQPLAPQPPEEPTEMTGPFMERLPWDGTSHRLTNGVDGHRPSSLPPLRSVTPKMEEADQLTGSFFSHLHWQA